MSKSKFDQKKFDIATKDMRANQKEAVRQVILDPTRTQKDILLAAGYSPSMAAKGCKSVLGHPSVKNALAEYVRLGNYDAKITAHYDQSLDIQPDDPLLENKLKILNYRQKAVSELHKIKGDYAPTKSEHKSVDITSLLPKFEADPSDETDD